MDTITDLIDGYIAMWNETDPARRRALIARVWSEEASYLDPMLQGEGATGIDAMVESVQARFPGHRFARTSPVDTHHDRVRFSWRLAPDQGAPLASGVDFAVLAADGRLRSVTGFFEPAQA